MSFALGKTTQKTLTGKVAIYQPQDNGAKKKVATLTITTDVLPRTEFFTLVESCDDKELLKQLVKNIESGDQQTETIAYTPDLMDDIYEIEWQFGPILDFVMRANNPRFAQALAAKN